MTPKVPGRFQAPRGTQDRLPKDQAAWRLVEEQAAALCRLYGFQRIDTPIFEETGLFVRGVGEATDIVEKEMYTFQDRGGTSLTLRPEGTAPVCRAYLEHGMSSWPQPVKLYYIAPIFRYDRPQAGRYRQHYQFGCETIGVADPAADAEVIHLAWELYQRLGLKRLTLFLNSIGCPSCRPAYLKQLRTYYVPQQERLCRDCRERLERNPLRLLDCKNESCQPLIEAAPPSRGFLCAECAQHFASLLGDLELLGIPYRLSHRLVRGLDYYTKTVFEFQPEAGGAQSTIGGGGRYDGLIEELGGPPTPAVGFATGLERILLNLRQEGIAVPPTRMPLVYLAYQGEGTHGSALALAAQLRAAGISTVVAFGKTSLKAQLRHAHALGADHVLIIGEDELQRREVTWRHMDSGAQEVLAWGEVTQRLTRATAG